MGLQIAMYIATRLLKTSAGRSVKDRQTAFSNSYRDCFAVNKRFIPLLSKHNACSLPKIADVVVGEQKSQRDLIGNETSAHCRPLSVSLQVGLLNPGSTLWHPISEALLQIPCRVTTTSRTSVTGERGQLQL